MPEPAQQLRLFEPPQPLVERLGTEFFRALPRAAGVYQMFDEADRLIYVGKAGDLRARLNSYRRTRNQSRKTIRLIHSARAIRWEICPSEAEARLRENELIRTHRPKFNRAGTWPHGEYLHIESSGESLELHLAKEPSPGCHGAFRSHVRLVLKTLGQRVWLAVHDKTSPGDIPYSLTAMEACRCLSIPGAQQDPWIELFHDYFGGKSTSLIDRLTAPEGRITNPFERTFHDTGTTLLAEFYERGPRRNRALRARFPVDRTWVEPIELDDLPIRIEVFGG